MIYPGYQLNPGDMFQVEPERVMFATGMTKNQDGHFKIQRQRETRAAKPEESEAALEDDQEAPADSELEPAQPSTTQVSDDAPSPKDPDAILKDRQKAIKALLTNAKTILEDPHNRLTAKRKQDWRAFSRLVRSTLSRARSATDETTSGLESQFQTLLTELQPTPAVPAPDNAAAGADASMSKEDQQLLREALERARENPADDSKPYATPWRPRPYMSPFAFIPRYLEVNQNVCSAVYLRHPVARPGLAEVPTPFHLETSQLAFSWYLRRR